jgi:hypothetical protein
MIDRRTSQEKLDNLVCALLHLRGRYGSSQISLACFLQHAEVAIFLEQRRVHPDALSLALGQLQQIGRIQDTAVRQDRGLSEHERGCIDRSIDSLFSALDQSLPAR